MYEAITYAPLGYGADVVPSTISLRSGWGELELDCPEPCRRIAGRAEALLASVGTLYMMTIDAEPDDPAQIVRLRVDVDGAPVHSEALRGRALVRVYLAPSRPSMRRVSILTSVGAVRIFRFAAIPHTREVVPVGSFRIGGGGWYAREASDPDVFRYVNREAQIWIDRPESSLELEVGPGPGVGHAPFRLEVLLGDERLLLHTFEIERRTRITVALPELGTLPKPLYLRCEGGGRFEPPDGRQSDFRLFAAPLP